MMGERLVMQESLFYAFRLEDHVPSDHLLRRIDRFVDCSELRQHLASFYSSTGRPSVDPELMIRMLLIGYCLGVRSERRLCEEVHLNLAYRWFCRLGLEGKVPDHSTFSKNRHGRFRECDLFRHLFEAVVQRCLDERLAADSAYGSAEMLHWLVDEQKIEPHVPVIDKSTREDGTFSRSDFTYDPETDTYTCPEGTTLTTSGRIVNEGTTRIYLGSTFDCGPCQLKERCCPNTPARKIPRSIYEHAREVARSLAGTPAFERSRQGRKRIEMLFAHLKRILKMGRLRLRGPCGAQDEFLLAATAQNLRKLSKLVASSGPQVPQGA
jgi:transposase